MKITRNNYEEYFLDFIDGKLSDALKIELEEFLLANPDLKEEIEEFEKVIPLEYPGIKFNHKSSLKKIIVPVGEINENNYENILVAEIEKDLKVSERENLEKFISKNPFVKKERKLFRKTFLVPGNNIIFENKAGLKRTAVFRIYWQQAAAVMAVAASLLLLIYLNFRKENFSPEVNNEFSEKNNLNINKGQKIIDSRLKNLPVESGIYSDKKIVSAEPSKEKFIRHKKNIASGHQPGNNKFSIDDIAQSVESLLSEKEVKNLENQNIAEIDPVKNQDNYMEMIIPGEEPGALYSEAQGKKYDVLPSVQKSASGDSFTLKEFLAFSFKKNILKEKVSKKKKNFRISPVDLASAFVNGVSNAFGSKMKMNKKYKDSGELASVSISSGAFEISRTLHGK